MLGEATGYAGRLLVALVGCWLCWEAVSCTVRLLAMLRGCCLCWEAADCPWGLLAMLEGSFPVVHAYVCISYLVASEVCQMSSFYLKNHVEMSTFVNFLKNVISNDISDE